MRRILFLIFILYHPFVFGQGGIEDPHAKLDKAVDLMDNGFPDEAIKLLQEAKSMDKKNYIYDYEMAYAYYIKKDNKKALELFRETLKYKDNTDQCYQMAGNFYDLNGEPEKALQTYNEGIKKFPSSGRLYLEKGNVFWGQKKYLEALPNYEKGIQVDPTFPSNYYRACIIFCNTEEPVWGMIYGEIFMNLEKNTKRTGEISKLLYTTYVDRIKIKGDTTHVSFSKNNTVKISDTQNLAAFKMPYGSGVYEPVLLLSVTGENAIDINTLDSIRTRFVDNYFKQTFSQGYPNVLFDYQKKLKENSFLSAYNHWLLMKGDEAAFHNWKDGNSTYWDSFIEWFEENSLQVTEANVFYRQKYE